MIGTGGEQQMTVERWLAAAIGDVRARGLDGTVPVLEAFAQAMITLRAADWSAGPGLPRDQPVAADGASGTRDSTLTAVNRGPTETNARVPSPPPRRSSDDPHTLEISEASERIRQRSLTSLALTESCLE